MKSLFRTKNYDFIIIKYYYEIFEILKSRQKQSFGDYVLMHSIYFKDVLLFKTETNFDKGFGLFLFWFIFMEGLKIS